MIIFLAFVWAIGILGTLACGFMLYRNEAVARHRRWLLETASVMAKKDIQAGRPWEWRYAAMEAVSYDDMMRKFWKPLIPGEFYKDVKFLQP